mmetsp:Transcript_15900/g.23950  ORF Transcript_15900/g.23950 Transcript_15900/m.23950 type:complete len:152 (-) Transcript_15900:188-643(-)|eukprot:CAMPEP_0185024612 /NCGR_PEP_ID=MMETSP1103-20130426/7762_1 /TAXON_ID=36769 /ORGANISM="Paraphysomonas bandaiensis, Strain Caron Lab Isolate" /LENGTH=151 /DNA_ID=CAMNT_0027557629 /DNA_START=51 /DNA_END=506 /DNA_ORIENTATION=+
MEYSFDQDMSELNVDAKPFVPGQHFSSSKAQEVIDMVPISNIAPTLFEERSTLPNTYSQSARHGHPELLKYMPQPLPSSHGRRQSLQKMQKGVLPQHYTYRQPSNQTSHIHGSGSDAYLRYQTNQRYGRSTVHQVHHSPPRQTYNRYAYAH